MNRYRVTVRTKANPDYVVDVDADTEGKAESRAMVSYPYRLRGALVRYTVREII